MELTEVDAIVEKYKSDKSWLVMILQDVQDVYNYLPEPALDRVAAKLDLGLSRVYNVATFYSSFSLEERGRHIIKVCNGTACHLRGGDNLREQVSRLLGVEEGETTSDKLFTLEVVSCLGACALAPVMTVDKKYYGKMTIEKVSQVLDLHRAKAPANGAGRTQ